MRTPRYCLIILVALLAANCTRQPTKNNIDVSSVLNDIDSHLPIGSSKADVIGFLDQQKIAHMWLQKAETGPNGKTVFPNNHTEIGIIKNVREDGFIFKTFVSIQIEFKFDDNDSKLISHSVREIYKGL